MIGNQIHVACFLLSILSPFLSSNHVVNTWEDIVMPFLNTEAGHTDQLEAVIQQVKVIDKSEGSIKNILSTLNVYLKNDVLSPTGLIDQLLYDFNNTLDRARCFYHETEKNKSSLSHLNDLKFAASNAVVIDIDKISLSSALLFIATQESDKCKINKSDAAGIIFALARRNSIHIGCFTITNWINGKKPRVTKTTIELIELLDDKFNLKGKLKRKLDKKTITNQSSRNSHPRVELNDKINQQIDDYIKYRTKGTLPERDHVFKDNHKDIKKLHQNPPGIKGWSLDMNNDTETGNKFRTLIQGFINFIHYYSNKHSIDVDFDISLIFDITWVNRYKMDCINRDIYKTPIMFFTAIKKEAVWNSYLSRYHAHIHELSEWHEEIDEIHENAVLNIIELKSIKKLDLDGKRNIEFILNDENPDQLINKIQDEFDYLIKTNTRGSLHSWTMQRSAFIFKISTNGMCPLRIKNFVNLKWIGESNKFEVKRNKVSCLYFDVNTDSYSIFVPKKDLKNRKGKHSNDIHRKLKKKMNDYIDNMLDIRDLFLKTKNGRIAENKFGSDSLLLLNPYNKDPRLSAHSLKVIQRIRPELNITTGINPHALRHLVATRYLKHKPEKYSALATLLNDKLETVINVYARRDDEGNSEELVELGDEIYGGTK